MSDVFARMKFCHPWRDYQARVLADLETHLGDDRLHIIAAPGAGKTVLGLEVMRRLARPTLILTPSIAIREQWADRLRQLFLPPGSRPAWISTDLSAPGPVTIATYQALHLLEASDALAGIGTLIVDEAHHLRNSWWRSLQDLTRDAAPRIVALTATPPYDANAAEWRRYEAFCGPVDAAISIPELVRSGDLAPHQDLIHLSAPDAAEAEKLAKIDAAAQGLLQAILDDADLARQIESHPWVTETRQHTQAILDAPELFSAMLIYLRALGRPVPAYGLRVLGVGKAELPPFTAPWAEHLTSGLLDALPEALLGTLRRARVIHKGRVKLDTTERQQTVLERSRAKLDSIAEITAAETAAMGVDLRLLILTDFIRAELLEQDNASADLTQMGVAPVFEMLRQGRADLGVLTGSLLIVPKGALTGDGITAHPLPHDPRYDRITLSGDDRRVALLTALFQAGTIRVMIGTRALLGQGWDMAGLNTLILASKVGAFVSSNQMRGRVIRVDPAHPAKAANIWHLATVSGAGGGPEYELLARRFDGFEALHVSDGRIASGVPTQLVDPAAANAQAMQRMTERASLNDRWQSALVAGGPNPRMRRQVFASGAQRVMRSGVLARLGLRSAALVPALIVWASGGTLLPVLFWAAAGMIVLWPALRDLGRLLRYGSLAGSIRQVGRALVAAMAEADLLEAPRDAITVTVGGAAAKVWCGLDGATLRDENQFLDAMEELLGPIDNPRYILVRESYLGRFLRLAPYAVPTALARKKDPAERFLSAWHRHVGPARLVYTRTVGGRWAMLQARGASRVDGRQTARRSVWE